MSADFIRAYFEAERLESLVFLGLGLVSLFVAAWLWATAVSPWWRGVIAPVALVGVIQVVVGWTVLTRSPHDIVRVTAMEPAQIQAEEIPRMVVVMRSFVLYRYLEIAILAGGLALLLLAASAFWRGTGAGMAVQAALMLLADFFAESRGEQYLSALRRLIGSS